MTLITFTDDGTRTTVSFPYDAEAVALLKDAVPSWDRSFDPDTKTWRVGKAWRPKITEAMTNAGHQVRDAADPPPRPPKPSPYSDPSEGGFFGIDDNDDFDTDAVVAAILSSVEDRHHGKILRAIARRLYPELYPKARR